MSSTADGASSIQAATASIAADNEEKWGSSKPVALGNDTRETSASVTTAKVPSLPTISSCSPASRGRGPGAEGRGSSAAAPLPAVESLGRTLPKASQKTSRL